MEIGNTIHFPFQDPIFDLYDVPKDNDREHVTIFAASEEEIAKYMHTFIDSSLKPIKVDIQPLGVYRYYFNEHLKSTEDKVYLFFELNLTSLTISIFNQHKIEFTRHQSLNVQHLDWEAHIKNSY